MDVLHVSPHPDDELIGAPATLMALRDAGHRIVNLAASLGAPESAERRRAELEEACRRAGFELAVTTVTPGTSWSPARSVPRSSAGADPSGGGSGACGGSFRCPRRSSHSVRSG